MRLLVGVSLVVAAIACSSSSSTVTGPSPAKCDLQLSLAASTLPAAGGSSQLTITTTPECSWTATSQASWLSGFTPSSGQGSGQVEFRASANSVASARQGEIVVNNERALVRQDAATCSVEVSPTSRDVGAAGGSTSVELTTLAGCTWSATSGASWVAVTPSSGSGSGTVTITVAANDAGSRTAVVTVAGQAVAIRQAGVVTSTCNVAIAPSTQPFGAAGGNGGPVQVSAAAGCSWSASSNASWIRITGGASGTGDGAVTYTVDANAGSARSGTLTIAGQTFTVTQEGVANCAFTVTPTSQRVDASGGTPPAIAVVTSSACSWSASSGADWVTIVSGASATGNGLVTYQVAANTGAERMATLTVAGHAVTVTQSAAPCSYQVTPTTVTIGASGGAGTPITLTTGGACDWAVASNASWITITSSSSGSGSTAVQYSVAANTGAERTGTITVAGQTVTVTQAAVSCSYEVAPTTVTIGAAGGAGTPIALTTVATCQWSATSNASWITITSSSSGSGSTAVQYSVAANTGAERTGTITVAGQTVTVTQAAVSCSYEVTPTTVTIGAAGGAGTPIALTTAATCQWSAASNASWITITSARSGTGPAAIQYTVAANTGGERRGTITIAGRSVEVTQAAAAPACSYTVDRTSVAVAAAGGVNSIAVTANGGCAWTAASSESWITITSGASGSGNGTVAFSVAANTGGPRTGVLTIAGHAVTVSQAAAEPPNCTITIAPTSQSAPAVGTTGSVSVTVASGCAWTAVSNAPWISVTGGQSGQGDGTVTYAVAANVGTARTGTITIAGQTFTINQAAVLACTYAISPTSYRAGEDGGTGVPIVVTAPLGCSWTAVANNGWITITSGASGTGPGTVTFSVNSFGGEQRTGTITVAGHTFTVIQEED